MVNFEFAVEIRAVGNGDGVGRDIGFRVELLPKELAESDGKPRLLDMVRELDKRVWISRFCWEIVRYVSSQEGHLTHLSVSPTL